MYSILSNTHSTKPQGVSKTLNPPTGKHLHSVRYAVKYVKSYEYNCFLILFRKYLGPILHQT